MTVGVSVSGVGKWPVLQEHGHPLLWRGSLFPVHFLSGISVEHGSSCALVEAVVGGCTQVARFYGGLTRVHTMIFVRFFGLTAVVVSVGQARAWCL